MSARPRSVPEVAAVDIHGGRLAVQFNWLTDRYGHTISLVRGGQSFRILESIEDTSDSIWPTSPPFQNLSDATIQSDTQQGRVTMLVGAAGKSHWAMTIAPRDHGIRREPLRFEPELHFDVACRVKELPLWIGSTYRACSGWADLAEPNRTVRMKIGEDIVDLISESAVVELDTASGRLPIIRLRATTETLDAHPETVRWSYEVRLRAALSH